MEDILQRKEALLLSLKGIKDKDERLRHIVDEGKAMPSFPDNLRLDAFLVKGCISRAWLVPQIKDDRLYFMADSEAMIVKGVVALLLKVYNGSTPKEIADMSTDFLSEAGVSEHLSMNRRNGLGNILSMIQHYARSMQKA
ncbi:MAG: SufE family protein [Proteobacteria bacterium]|nr:MAG: SufE family protein [Pseudomonadota bacterium]